MRVKRKYVRGTVQERLAARTIEDPATGCLLWTGGRIGNGYGCLKIGGSATLAHRAAWIVAHGTIPDGLCVLHRCDVRHCLRVDHLFLGTVADNNADRNAKGRQSRGSKHRAACIDTRPRGEAHPRAKVNDDDVREIRALSAAGCTLRQLEHRFRLSNSTLSRIVTGKTWRHI